MAGRRQRAGSREQRVRGGEQGAGSREQRARGGEQRARSGLIPEILQL